MPAYTTLPLTRTWLTSTSDPTNSLVVGTVRQSAPTLEVPGRIRTFASGRKQGVGSTPAVQRTFPILLRALNSKAVDWLYAHISETVLLRTKAGESAFVRYFSIAPRPQGAAITGSTYNPLPNAVIGHIYDVDVDFREVTYIEAP